jgi:hypothetical protein
MASIDATKGYILEEILAYLIRNAGYKLLVDPSQDPNDLVWKSNGLVVVGRGSYHQVDVLGQLEWFPSFTFPIRLFAEAKFRSSTTSLNHVRNAVGTILDINQRYSRLLEESNGDTIFHPHFQYAYALFSTSGFTEPATTMALAHQISLVDLSGNEFKVLRDSITNAVVRLGVSIPRRVVIEIRHFLRRELGTAPDNLPINSNYPYQQLPVSHDVQIYLQDVIDTTLEYGELFIGMINGPFILMLKADHIRDFLSYAIEKPNHGVTISWSPNIDEGNTWEIQPSYGDHKYRLTFRLPSLLARWIFESEEQSRARALHAKQALFSSITIFTRNEGHDYLFRLNFDAEETAQKLRQNLREWKKK